MFRVLALALAGLVLFSCVDVDVGLSDGAQPAVPAVEETPVAADAPAAPAVAKEEPALPPDAFVEKSFFEQLADGSFLAKLAALLVSVVVFLRALAELLTRIANWTDAKWDNKLAAAVSEAAWILGAFLGKFGYGVPIPVAQESAEKLAAKTMMNAGVESKK